MKILDSYPRVMMKIKKTGKIFGYLLMSVMPEACVFGPQEESDAFEAKLDKCIADRVDYFAEEFGYDTKQKNEEARRTQHIFID